MKVHYENGMVKGVVTIDELVKDRLSQLPNSQQGQIESIEEKLMGMQELVTDLIEILTAKSILSLEDLSKLLETTITEIECKGKEMKKKTSITYITGDATQPQGNGKIIIPHICNDIGAWGAGFVLALSKRWKGPEETYRKAKKNLGLGLVQFVRVEDNIWVANMVAQHDIRPDDEGRSPIRYNALKACLFTVAEMAIEVNASIHMPRIGAGLAGGNWDRIELIIEETLVRDGIDVTVYNFG